MSSLPLHTASELLSPASVDVRRASLFQHIAKSAKFADVHPASQLQVRPRPEMLSSGIAELDAVTGGIPCGCMTVLYGPASSGKTSALLAALAKNTQEEGTCVLIDASDSFDPKSAAAAGVNFNRLLWVRCGEKPKQSPVPSTRFACSGQAKNGRRSSAVQDFSREVPRTRNQEPRADHQRPTTTSEIRLEQVLKTTDLILQSGGFGLVVLDLAGIPEKFVRRIPLASWFRFQRAVEHAKTAMLVVSEFPCSQTCAALVLQLSTQHRGCPILISPFLGEPRRRHSCHLSGTPAHTQLFEQMIVEAELVRSRLDRKPMQSVKTSFTTKAVRAGGF